MATKPTDEALEQRVKERENEVAERKLAQEPFPISQETLRSLIDNAPGIIIIVDRKGIIRYINHTVPGLERKEVVGTSHYDYAAAEYHKVMQESIERVFETGETTSYKIAGLGPDGSTAWYMSRLGPIKHDGEVVAVAIMPIDITEQKKAEEALHQSEEQFRQMAELSPFPISMIESDGRYLYVNKQFTEVFGYKLEDIPTGRDWFHKAYPDSEYRRKVISAWKSDSVKSVKCEVRPREFEVVCKDSTVRHIIFRPVSMDNGRQLTTYEDLTERKQAEEALRESEAKYRSLYDTMKEGVAIHEVVYDASGEAKDYIILDVNPSYEKILGLKKEEAVDCKASELYGTGQPPYIEIYARVTASGQPTSFETYFPPMDKHFSISVFSPRRGQFATVFADITERKRAEMELIERQATLEAQTNELEEVNAALRVLLKRRDEDRTELEEKVLSNVKELVLPYAEKLKKTRLDAKQKAYLRILESNLNDIISPFARALSSTYVALTPTEIEIAHLVKDGKTAKEIAEMLNVSVRTIEFHKKGIRRKLGLRNRKVNLRSHLMSMTN